MKVFTFGLGVAAALLGTFLPSQHVLAQQGSEGLEEIIVTSERREASLQDVPIAVSAFNEVMLEKFQIDETIELVNVVPNLFGGNNTGLGTANMYYLRAQGNDESIATFDPPVGTYVDDVYITRQNANNFAFFDVERIEVLRGPQGTLFGRNTTGGAINVILKKPAEELGGYVEAGVGRFGGTILRGSVDIPVTSTFLTKFSAFSLQDDGWLDNVADGNTYNDRENLGLRGAFRWLIGESFTWDLSVDFLDSNEANVYGEVISDDRRESTSLLPSTGVPAALGTQKSDYGNDVEQLSVVSNMGWSMFGGDANLIVGYRDLEQNFLLNFPNGDNDDFFWIDNTGTHEMTTVELKWNASLFDDRVNLVTGLFVLDEENSTDFADYLQLTLPPPVGILPLRLADRVLDNTTQSWAFYLQGDILIGERGTLTLGARFTDEEKEITLSDNTGADVLTTANLIAAGVPTKQTESNVTPRIAYRYAFNDDVSAYVSATNGFKSGGWNARGTSPGAFLPFGPEEIWSYEVGLRADWADGRVRTNLTLFYSDLKDLQTTSATPDGQFLTTNAGGIENPGLELEMTALATDNWEIFFGLGLQDAEYVDLPDGCVVPNLSFAAYDEDCNAATPKRAPKTTATLASTWTIPIGGSGMNVQPTISFRYIGSNVVGTRNLGANERTTLINAGLALNGANNQWSVVAECRNCTDEVYTLSELFVSYPTPPGIWQLRARFNFGER
jgi:iron complex outermembrane receptor protein